MALVINTNMSSLNAQRNLRKTEGPMQTSMQRLSSGLRINSAKDDAAGMAISTRMDLQIRGLTGAIRNANDGLSFIQTAEGAVNEMVFDVERIYELAVQAASKNTRIDREALDREVQDRLSELERIVSQTRFNGEKFLNRQVTWTYQVGPKVGESITVSTQNVSPSSLGMSSTFDEDWKEDVVARSAWSMYNEAGGGTNKAGRDGFNNDIALNTIDLGGKMKQEEVLNNSKTVIDRMNDYVEKTEIRGFSYGNALVASEAVSGTAGGIEGAIMINGVAIGSFSATGSANETAKNVVSVVNDKFESTGVKAFIVSEARLVFSNTTGASITYAVDVSKFRTSAGEVAAEMKLGVDSNVEIEADQNGVIVLNDLRTGAGVGTAVFNSSSTVAMFGYGKADLYNPDTEIRDDEGRIIKNDDGSWRTEAKTTSYTIQRREAGDKYVGLERTPLKELEIKTLSSSKITLMAAERALDQLNTFKSAMGASMNRMSSTIRNLDNVRENITAAQSRIQDADFAMETADLTKNMILQQAGLSVLSQANSMPRNVLSLLQL